MISIGIDIGGGSIKCAIFRHGRPLTTRQSHSYQRPDRAQLVSALRAAVGDVSLQFDAAGLCVPGLLNSDRRTVEWSVNVPGLNGVSLDELITESLGAGCPPPVLVTDAQAAAFDLYQSRKLFGRLFLLALGTGVGAAVWDENGSLAVDGQSAGHWGQMDVSLETPAPMGPDGGAGSLEAYVSAAVLRREFGSDFYNQIGNLAVNSIPLRAIARAIRIAHAIYRPHHVCLTGGIGNALASLVGPLRAQIQMALTKIARPGWTLTTGDSVFHAACGAAKWSESHRSFPVARP